MSFVDDIFSTPQGGFSFATGPALKTVISWLSKPIIAGIPIETTSYREVCNSDVSEMPVISPTSSTTAGKNYITDNSAPRPRQWEIQGFIGSAIPLTEPSSLSMIMQPTLIIQKGVLQNAWLKRTPVNFQPLNKLDLGGLKLGNIQVQIKNLTFDTTPQITNKIPVSISLVEVPYIIINNGVQISSNAAISNVTGQTLKVGSISALKRF